MKFVPEPYQQQGIDHILTRDASALWFEPGLGKTALTLEACRDLMADTVGSVLIIAPLKVCNLVWPDEIQKWDQFKWMRVVHLNTIKSAKRFLAGDGDVFIMNWDKIPWLVDKVLSKLRKGTRLKTKTIILDESSKLKNPKSVWGKKLRRFRYLFKYVIELTGSPSPNSYQDLWGQFRFLDNGKTLGTSFGAYQTEYFRKTDWHGYTWKIRKGAAQQIEKLIAPFVLSMKRDEYLDIPPVHIIDIEVPLTKPLQEMYDALEKELLLDLGHETVTAVNAAALVNKLSQFTGGAIYIDGEPGEEKKARQVHTLKVEALKRLINKEAKGSPVFVATMFNHERRLYKRHIPHIVEFQDSMADDWNKRKIPLITGDPRSMGHGLNLQGGNVAVWCSLTYSREIYDQFNMRFARKGQTRETFIYRLICPNTVDDVMSVILEDKGRNQQNLLTAIHKLKLLAESK